MRLLVDMNLSPGWVAFLRGAGFAAVHWSDIAAPDASESVLMSWAAAHDQIVLTDDLDFSAILAATRRRKPSVVQIRVDLLTPSAIGGAPLQTLEQTRVEVDEGALVTLDPVRARVRILPLRSR